MGSLWITLGAGALVAAVFAPTASAAGAQGVFLTPASPLPGGGVRLAVRGCAAKSGSAASDAFSAAARLAGSGGLLTGDARVRAAARPGLYSVTVDCDGRVVKGTLLVGGHQAAAPSLPIAPSTPPAAPRSAAASPAAPAVSGGAVAPAPRVSSGAAATPTAHSSPVAPVHAGGGATASLPSASDARSAGPGVLQAVIGLVLAGVAAIVVIARSIRRGRGRE
ncbi:hypothetical protein ACIHAA_06565 [Streptomyces sp. NPDC052040]|uniref:hypothetical protein n=1 Tax=unclassified Streptomyces TaxID=2593676 RepID=UPI0037D34C3F